MLPEILVRPLVIAFACAAVGPAQQTPTQPTPVQQAPASAPSRYGQFVREVGGLQQPGGAAFDAEGRLWVTERMSGAVRAFGPDGAELARFALEAQPGLPREPRGIAISPAGEILVADAVEHVVVVLDGSGATKRKIGKRGAGPGELREPRGITVAGGKLYVADAGNHRIAVFALDGTFERALGRRGFGAGDLLAPNDVAVDAQGRTYVADLGNQRIARFAADGQFEKAWGGLGPYSGLFHAPTGIAARGGRVFVADRDNHRIQVFDADGKPDHEWGVHAVRPREGGGKLHYPSAIALSAKGDLAAVVEDLEGRVQLFGDQGDTGADPPVVDRSATAHYEGGCDAARNLLAILEPAGPSVSIFDMAHPTPIEITRFGRSGAAAGKFLVPADVEFAADGKSVWVSDPLLHRISQWSLAYEPGGILKFDPYMAKFVRSLQLDELQGVPATPWPTEPTALELGPDGRMYVADRANGRVLVLAQDWTVAGVLGAAGTGAGRLLEPTAVVVDADNRVHIADARGRKVETFVSQFSDPSGRGPRYPDPLYNPISAAATRVPVGERTGRPRGLASDGAKGLWVALEEAHALVRLDEEGRVTTTVGTPGTSGLGKLAWSHPEGLARTPDGAIVAIDAGNHRFQVLAPDGAFRTAWGSRLFLEPILKAK